MPLTQGPGSHKEGEQQLVVRGVVLPSSPCSDRGRRRRRRKQPAICRPQPAQVVTGVVWLQSIPRQTVLIEQTPVGRRQLPLSDSGVRHPGTSVLFMTLATHHSAGHPDPFR